MNPKIPGSDNNFNVFMMPEPYINQILEDLFRIRGIDFSEYRRSILAKRIFARINTLGLNNPEAYLKKLKADPSEYDHLIDSILIKVSTFFRNPLVFELIAQDILPAIIEQSKKSGNKEIRVWSAGCAAGEEAYSIAMLISDAVKTEEDDWNCYIFATDISKEALQVAEKGVYLWEHFEHMKVGFLDKYIVQVSNSYQICPSIKSMVAFSHDNLISKELIAPAESIFGTFDLILCRNVLIYFEFALQERIGQKLYKALKPGGYLVLGHCESLSSGIGNQLIPVDRKNRIFQKPV